MHNTPKSLALSQVHSDANHIIGTLSSSDSDVTIPIYEDNWLAAFHWAEMMQRSYAAIYPTLDTENDRYRLHSVMLDVREGCKNCGVLNNRVSGFRAALEEIQNAPGTIIPCITTAVQYLGIIKKAFRYSDGRRSERDFLYRRNLYMLDSYQLIHTAVHGYTFADDASAEQETAVPLAGRAVAQAVEAVINTAEAAMDLTNTIDATQEVIDGIMVNMTAIPSNAVPPPPMWQP